jgi:hypothetical protein
MCIKLVRLARRYTTSGFCRRYTTSGFCRHIGYGSTDYLPAFGNGRLIEAKGRPATGAAGISTAPPAGVGGSDRPPSGAVGGLARWEERLVTSQ